MGLIGPDRTNKELEESGRSTSKGGKKGKGLPGLKTDARTMDPEAHEANRELATRISKAVADIKPSDGGQPRFVLGWRLYPNRDSAYWKTEGAHVCGCGCACSAGKEQEEKTKKKKKTEKEIKKDHPRK
jgi:hypothetical protein